MSIEVDSHRYCFELERDTYQPTNLITLFEDEDDEDDDKPGFEDDDDVLPSLNAAAVASPPVSTPPTAVHEEQPPQSTASDSEADSEAVKSCPQEETPVGPPETEFMYNPIHDLESVWWVALYMVSCSQPADTHLSGMDPTTREQLLRNHAELAALAFESDIGDRRDLLTSSKMFKGMVAKLLPAYAAIGAKLDTIRRAIVSTYLEAEEDVSKIDFNAASNIYKPIREAFAEIAESLKGEKDIQIAWTDTSAIDVYLDRMKKLKAEPAEPAPAEEKDEEDEEDARPAKVRKTRRNATISSSAAL